MKKTKKALLIALACATAVMGASALTACNKGNTPATPTHTHSESWNTWTVTKKPTENDKGTATRTCTNDGCDAAETDKTYELPKLNNTDYVKGGDSATCVAEGKVHYTYNKDGVSVEFDVDTPKSAEHKWGKWTVEKDNEPTTDKEGKATRTCTVSGCTVAAEEHTLPKLNETDYTVSEDTAQVGVPGEVTYTYDKEGVKAVITVATPAKPHVHSDWSWTVTDENKPTFNKEGKATRTCTAEDDFCDWETSDLEAVLPLLDDERYVKGKDSADCNVAGKQQYSITIDGKVATFTVDTVALTPDVIQVTGSSVPKGSLALPSGSMLETTTFNHYTCNTCGKIFSSNVHDEANLITSVKYVSNRGQFFETVVGNNKIRVRRDCGLYFKADADGIYKINSENATGIKVIYYFGSKETGTNYSTVVNNSKWDKSAAEFGRFTSSPENPVKCVYVNMSAGDVIMIGYVNADVHNVEIEKINEADAPLCQMHVAGDFDFSGFNVAGGVLEKKCAVCGNTVESVSYDAGKTVEQANESTPVSLGDGAVLVKMTQTAAYYSFTPDKAGTYGISLKGLTAHALTLGTRINIKDSTTPAAMNMGGTWYFNSPYDNGAMTIASTANSVDILLKVSGDAVGKTLIFDITADGASAEKPAYILTEAAAANQLTYGVNTVNITDDNNATFIDKYEFVPTETKTYSLKVPAGVEVTMDDQDFITEATATTVNFQGTKDKKIVFAFKYSEVGNIQVEIGEEYTEVVIPVLELTTDASNPNSLGVSMVGKTAIPVKIGDGLEVGKKYTVKFDGGFILSKQTGAGALYFKLNGEDNTFDTMTGNSDENVIYLAASTSSGTTPNGCEFNCSADSSVGITVTFTATGNDMIYLAITNKNIPATSTVGDLVLTLTAAE